MHALAQVVNFKTKSSISPDKLQLALNGVLPKDISIIDVRDADLDFHSRFDAKSKIYRYTILNRKFPSVFLKDTAYFCSWPLDVELMRREAKILLGRHNFKSFRASEKKERGLVRTIKKIKVAKDGDLVYIDIEANGFLYNMARNIAGTLIEIGRGRFPPGYLKKILSVQDRRFAGPTAPARGLCLIKVSY